MKKINLGLVGVGAVGEEILRILCQRNFPFNNLRIFARTARKIKVDGVTYSVENISDQNFDGIDITFFAGTEGEKGASVLYAHKFIEKGAIVIDNGNDFRLKKEVPLVVPEVNSDKIYSHKGLIANPNCTTIQAVTALGGIYKAFGLEQFLVTSFQATSGAGREAASSLWKETASIVNKNKDIDFSQLDKVINSDPECFSKQIAFNTIAQIGSFADDDYTTEELKVVNESRKILDDISIKVSATCVRAPVFTSHCESIYFITKDKAELSDLKNVLGDSGGVKYLSNDLCSPLEAEGKDEVFVSRLRKDPYAENAFWLWCVSDNLRKGAALNAVQIAEHLTAES